MSDDIVTRLRLWASVTEGDHVIEEFHKAADEIERLRKELAKYPKPPRIQPVSSAPMPNGFDLLPKWYQNFSDWLDTKGW